ncbi:exosortase A [Crenalkalicoccus roseus]|uniref:exosortase A n=1 Tax=Crenalkalicoccus roseus TaxID=1485588 RepID=UPI0013051A01|nr:exosortase A [Crenalkalicoccus roseus]
MNAIGGAAEAPGIATGTEPGRAGRAWAPVLVALGLGVAALLLLFRAEAAAAVRVWNSSTAYNHCWLVLPIAAWLAWTRRHRLAGLSPAPAPWLALLALPPALAWLAAERLGIMEGRQLAALALIEVFILAVVGWRVARAMAAPLAYLVFLVPFGEFATPLLQDITAWMIELGLRLLGITHYRDGLLIETTAGLFHVAEACAGLRFIIAALAFGALYALVMFRSPGRRIVVMVLAVTVPVLANGLRALGIVVLGSYLGSAEAAAADHVIYGWGFFSVVMLLLILAGLPFREDAAPSPRPDAAWPVRAPRRAALAGAAGLALALAAAGPALAGVLDPAGGQAPRAIPPRLAAPEGCAPMPEGAGLRCEGAVVTAQLLAFSPRVTWGAVAATRHRLMAEGSDTDVTFRIAVPGSAAWNGRHVGEAGAMAAAAWLNGAPTGGGLRSRIAQAWNSLGGGGGAPVLAVVTLRPEGAGGLGPPRERALLQAVLEAQAEGLAAQAVALSQGR